MSNTPSKPFACPFVKTVSVQQQQHQQQPFPTTTTSPSSANSSRALLSNSELLHYFECPICYDHITPPIVQCRSGHVVCDRCLSRVLYCPQCRGPINEGIRNLFMERIAGALKYPCRYSASGCPATFAFGEKIEHEGTCTFKRYECPLTKSTLYNYATSCDWHGSLAGVFFHLQHQHRNVTAVECDSATFIAEGVTLPSNGNWILVQKCFGQCFVLIMRLEHVDGEAKFYAAVQIIGDGNDCDRFSYKLVLNGRNRSQLTWEAVPLIGLHLAQLYDDNVCLRFGWQAAQNFIQDGNLTINVTLSTITDYTRL